MKPIRDIMQLSRTFTLRQQRPNGSRSKSLAFLVPYLAFLGSKPYWTLGSFSLW